MKFLKLIKDLTDKVKGMEMTRFELADNVNTGNGVSINPRHVPYALLSNNHMSFHGGVQLASDLPASSAIVVLPSGYILSEQCYMFLVKWGSPCTVHLLRNAEGDNRIMLDNNFGVTAGTYFLNGTAKVKKISGGGYYLDCLRRWCGYENLRHLKRNFRKNKNSYICSGTKENKQEVDFPCKWKRSTKLRHGWIYRAPIYSLFWRSLHRRHSATTHDWRFSIDCNDWLLWWKSNICRVYKNNCKNIELSCWLSKCGTLCLRKVNDMRGCIA